MFNANLRRLQKFTKGDLAEQLTKEERKSNDETGEAHQDEVMELDDGANEEGPCTSGQNEEQGNSQEQNIYINFAERNQV